MRNASSVQMAVVVALLTSGCGEMLDYWCDNLGFRCAQDAS